MIKTNNYYSNRYSINRMIFSMVFIACFIFSVGNILFNNNISNAFATEYPQDKEINMVVGDVKNTSSIMYRFGTNATVNYVSSDKSIATVRSNYVFFTAPDGAWENHHGIVTGVGEGEAVIFATDKTGAIICAYPVIVHKRVVAAPILPTNFNYTGRYVNLLKYIDDSYYNISGDTNKIHAGNYSIVLSLKNKHGYVWSDGTKNDKVVNYRINKVHNNMKVSINKHIIKMYTNCQQVIPITIKNSTKNISIKTSNKKIKVGSNKDCIIIPRNFYGNIKIVIKDKGDKDHCSKTVVLKLKVKK